jgi:uncharacterized protein with HEPN domain
MSAKKNLSLRVEHILDAIGRIQQYTSGLTEESFGTNQMAVDAVIRNFLIIGEAARHIPADVQAKHSEIPWPLMQGMRNVLVHDYEAVKLDIVWKTIQVSLPPLVEPLRKLLEECSQ